MVTTDPKGHASGRRKVILEGKFEMGGGMKNKESGEYIGKCKKKQTRLYKTVALRHTPMKQNQNARK